MFIDDEHFITNSNVLFASNTALERRFADLNGQIQSAVDALTDDQALSIDADDWAAQVTHGLAVKAPTVDIEGAQVEHLGRIDVDCTGKPGISHSLTEVQVIRPGHRFRVLVPVTGESELLVARPSAGFEPLRADFADGCILRSWNWPEVARPDSFDRSVEAFKHTLSQGALRVAHDVEVGNASIDGSVRSALESRREAILAERTFLGSLSVPVKPAPDAPKPLRAPPIRSRSTPARRLAAKLAVVVEQGPDMAEFYEHILGLVRAVGRGMERSPGSFADADEETLRDHMLVTLNTHYVGRTYAEAFNRSGKTDLLIRIHDLNAFIGECKWSGGPKRLYDALDQLFGYTTWRDSRLALIFYVREQNLTSIIKKAHAQVRERAEFVSGETPGSEGEFRCRVRWPDDPEREAILTVLFFHIG